MSGTATLPEVGPGPRAGLEVVDVLAQLGRRARLIAALARALACEHEARWRTMSRAYEAAERRIAEREQALRKLEQERITQEMLEARHGARRV